MISGSAQAITANEVIVLDYVRGNLFGERAILENKLRSIDIIATENVIALNIDPE